MKIPYNRVHATGDVLFAARGGKLHSFSLLDGSHISTWQHPDVAAAPDVAARQAEADEPPAKRQRLLETGRDDAGDDAGAAEAGGDDAPDDAGARAEDEKQRQQQDETSKNKKKKKKKKKNAAGHDADGDSPQLARAPDRPVITQVTSSADGHHVLAVSGHDKTIWVFEHDGHGGLAKISQRTMPKRPSATVIGPDSQIVCADKFGDVYALPLIASPSPSPAAPPPARSRPAAPAGSTLTVHSQRNREALLNQQKQLARERQRGGDASPARADDGPAFELALLLGHVSMLTAVAVGDGGDGRRYLLTADRDEHIRVSRGAPHAHVIDGFCLGHRHFVGDMVIPPGRPDVLVSGGGDDDLFVWDWRAGRVRSRAAVLALAREVAPAAASVAVSGLQALAYPSESGPLTYVLAICEDIPAVFAWQLSRDGALRFPAAIELPGKPLHVCVSGSSPAAAAPPRLVVAMDPGRAPAGTSLQALSLAVSDGRLVVDAVSSPFQDEALAADEADVPESEIRRLLYTVENLRKQTGGGEDDGPEAGIEVEVKVDETRPVQE